MVLERTAGQTSRSCGVSETGIESLERTGGAMEDCVRAMPCCMSIELCNCSADSGPWVVDLKVWAKMSCYCKTAP